MLSFLCENKVFTVLLLDCPKCFIIVEYTSIVHFLVLVSTSFLLLCTPSYFRSTEFRFSPLRLIYYFCSKLAHCIIYHLYITYVRISIIYWAIELLLNKCQEKIFSQVIKLKKERAPIESITFHVVKSTSTYTCNNTFCY